MVAKLERIRETNEEKNVKTFHVDRIINETSEILLPNEVLALWNPRCIWEVVLSASFTKLYHLLQKVNCIRFNQQAGKKKEKKNSFRSLYKLFKLQNPFPHLQNAEEEWMPKNLSASGDIDLMLCKWVWEILVVFFIICLIDLIPQMGLIIQQNLWPTKPFQHVWHVPFVVTHE